MAHDAYKYIQLLGQLFTDGHKDSLSALQGTLVLVLATMKKINMSVSEQQEVRDNLAAIAFLVRKEFAYEKVASWIRE
jgi:hypothetical protein